MAPLPLSAKRFEPLAACCVLILAAVQLATLSLAVAQPGTGPAGFVKSFTPPVFIRSGTGPLLPAKVGDGLRPGTTISTGAQGAVVLLFADGQNVTLSKESTLRIDDYRYEAANAKAGRASIALVSGGMRVVTGAIHTENPAALRISAGTGVVSVLSKDVTAFVIEAKPGDDLRPGWAAVTVGEIAIRTPSGLIARIVADQFARWRDGTAPTLPQPLAAAPAVYQALVAASRANVGETNTPIDVRSASVQAALLVAQGAEQGAGAKVLTAALSGRLNAVSGPVFIRGDSGGEVQAKVGDVFGPGTRLTTGNGGQVGLLFSLGQYASLGTDSTLRIGDAGPDRSEPKTIRSAFELEKGRVSFVTFAAPTENQDAFTIGAGNAVIGILNKGAAAFVVEVDSKSREIGSAAVTIGELSIKTPDGLATRVNSDQYTRWQPGFAPDPPQSLAAAPAVLQGAIISPLIRVPLDVEATTVKLALAYLPATASDAARARAVEQAAVNLSLASLPATAAGPAQVQAEAQVEPVALAPVIVPSVTPGGGGGCTGSPC